MSGLRVIAGTLRGRRFQAPPGRDTRPTSDRVRESIFDLLGPRPRGGRVLDLFAGSGALGIEALSRGATFACFVESDRRAGRILRENLAALGLADRARVSSADALGRTAWPEGPFDLILADPPYGCPDLEALAVRVAARLAPGGAFVLECAAGDPRPAVSGLALRKDRRYGSTSVILYEQEESPS